MVYGDMPDVERGIEFRNILYVSLYNNVAKALSSLNCQFIIEADRHAKVSDSC